MPFLKRKAQNQFYGAFDILRITDSKSGNRLKQKTNQHRTSQNAQNDYSSNLDAEI